MSPSLSPPFNFLNRIIVSSTSSHPDLQLWQEIELSPQFGVKLKQSKGIIDKYPHVRLLNTINASFTFSHADLDLQFEIELERT